VHDETTLIEAACDMNRMSRQEIQLVWST